MGMFDPIQRSAAVQQAFDQLNSQLNFSKPKTYNPESPKAIREMMMKAEQEGDFTKAKFYQKRLDALMKQRDQLTGADPAMGGAVERNKMLARRAEANMPRTEEEELEYLGNKLDFGEKQFKALERQVSLIPIPSKPEDQMKVLKQLPPQQQSIYQERVQKYRDVESQIQKRVEDLSPRRAEAPRSLEELRKAFPEMTPAQYEQYVLLEKEGLEGNFLSSMASAEAKKQTGKKKEEDGLEKLSEGTAVKLVTQALSEIMEDEDPDKIAKMTSEILEYYLNTDATVKEAVQWGLDPRSALGAKDSIAQRKAEDNLRNMSDAELERLYNSLGD